MKWLRQFLRQESNNSRVAYGLAIAGHVIIALLLLLGLFERIEPASVAAIPVEIVMDSPGAPASPPLAPALDEQNDQPVIPAVADVDKHAKAPLGTLDVNGINLPKQPGHDGGDPADAEPAPGAGSLPSWTIEPLGLAQRQMTAREPGEDEMTAIKETKIECGHKARWPSPSAGIRQRGRVIGIATEAQALAMIRSSQFMTDRRINPNYIRNQQVFAETLDGTKKSSVVLPTGLTVNVGDVIEIDSGHVDPSDSCQYIPNLAASKH